MDPTDRILDKLDKIQESQLKHSELLARHTVLHEANSKSLDLHIKRTDLLELKLEADMKTALLPINSIKWVLKALAGVVVILTLLKLLGII